MDSINFTEPDQRILSELKALFEFASPGRLRRSLLDLYFHCLLTSDPDSYRGPTCPARRN